MGKEQQIWKNDDPAGGPLQVALMALGHVFINDVELTGEIASLVAGGPAVLEKDFHSGSGQAHIDLLTGQLVGDTVVVEIDLHVVVDIDPSLLPLGEFITLRTDSELTTLSNFPGPAPAAQGIVPFFSKVTW
jgi:hypothetical protein